MFEADSYCLVLWLYSTIMSLSGLALFWWLDVQPGLQILADSVLAVWVGVTIWGLTWMKVWMAKPTFNSGKSFFLRTENDFAKDRCLNSLLNVVYCLVHRVSITLYS